MSAGLLADISCTQSALMIDTISHSKFILYIMIFLLPVDNQAYFQNLKLRMVVYNFLLQFVLYEN